MDVRIAVCYHDDGDPNYNNYCPPLAGIGKVTISKGSSILLGETKYYYAIKDESGKLQIKETLDPDVGEGITSVIMEDPVIAKDAVNNDKNGVYWDYYKPDGTGLDNGVIRLIGRYWKQDRTYKVTLHGVLPTDGSDASIEIEVKKPDVLGDKKLSPKERHSVVKDVTADPNSSDCNLDLDALIIKYAGENGIPPQIIKGQMLKETGFRPAWRYEPFKDVEYQNEDKRDNYFGEDMYFVVTKSSTGTVSMGTGDWPTTHRNVYSGINTLTVTPYNRDAVTVGYYLSQHWNDYVRHGTGSIPDEIVGGKALTKRWKVLYDIEKTKKQSDAAARQNAHTKLVDELVDPDTKLGGDYDIMAQTRKVTSYGFVQMMYITAADNRFLKNPLGWYEPTGPQYVDQYDEHLYPEKLNEQDFLMPRYCDLLLKNLNFMFTGPIPPSQWITNKGGTTSAGFEAIWKRALQSYNPGEADYGKNVLINADMFKPAK